MSLRLGDIAPDFNAQTTLGPIYFYEYLGHHWGILFSHPADFTPVCTTELGMVARLQPEFDRRGVKVLALSVDPLSSHMEWLRDIEETQQVRLRYPIIADEDMNISRLFSFIHPNASDRATVRSVIIVSPDKRVRLMITYPASTGRNFDEILRVIDSLQLTDRHQVATPANWKQGEDVVVLPSVKTENIPAAINKNFREIKPYLRMIQCPDEIRN